MKGETDVMKERTLVYMTFTENCMNLRTVSRSRKSPHRFYICRHTLEELEQKEPVPLPQPIKPNMAAEKPQPAQPKASGTQIQKPGIAQPPATDKKASAVQTQQTKTTEPAQAEKPQAENPKAYDRT